MCDTCGCEQPPEAVTYRKPGDNAHEHTHHNHNHEHSHDYGHHHHKNRTIAVEMDVLAKNNLIAAQNRGYFDAKNILALNFVSSPGSGKTTLLEQTIQKLTPEHQIAVIEGDQQTLRDAERIEATGAPVIQVNTGKGCHLDADMIHKSLHELSLPDNSILFIENVGNLVCPALFDLGEAMKVVVISVTEGEDKPQKYPHMFAAADICVINKTDLLPYVDFDVEKCKQYALEVNHHLKFFEVSATKGDGLNDWISWVNELVSS